MGWPGLTSCTVSSSFTNISAIIAIQDISIGGVIEQYSAVQDQACLDYVLFLCLFIYSPCPHSVHALALHGAVPTPEMNSHDTLPYTIVAGIPHAFTDRCLCTEILACLTVRRVCERVHRNASSVVRKWCHAPPCISSINTSEDLSHQVSVHHFNNCLRPDPTPRRDEADCLDRNLCYCCSR